MTVAPSTVWPLPGEPLPGEPPGEPPPGEPPPDVACEVTWRMAARLIRDHRLAPRCPMCDDGTGDRCVSCHQPWPCSARRLAELGLIRSAL
jgi:hypothetical protein